ncbi:hypothetical protein D3C71_2073780 [compost metagenome]
MAHFIHARRQPCGAVVQLASRVGDGVDHPLIAGLHGIERIGHLSDFVVACQRDASREVAAFLDVEHHVFQGVELAKQEADQ